jgi:hypothetical protein
MLSIQRVKPILNIVTIGRGQILFSFDNAVAISVAALPQDILVDGELVKVNTTIDFVTAKDCSRVTQGHINWFLGKKSRKEAHVISQERLESWNGTTFEKDQEG